MTDWKHYLHAIRKSEIVSILDMLPRAHFAAGLECGAGDTYQTTLLAPHFDTYISSDLNSARFDSSLVLPHVTYMQVDADAIAHMFQEKQFDVIFSSNMLEHVADPIRFLHATRPFLKDDGYAIHVVPSRGIKISYILLYYPYLIRLVYRKIRDHKKGSQLFGGHAHSHENNINVKTDTQKIQSRFRRFLFPSIHGNFPTHRAEYHAYGKNVWQRMFQNAGYTIVNYQKGPAFSGYGFGCVRTRRLLERFGFSSEHIFVLQSMSAFEQRARTFTYSVLPRASYYEQEKFIRDWMNKEKSAHSFLNDFIHAVGNPYEKKVLDVGFGNGIILSAFRESGADAYGLEIDEKLFAIGQQTMKEKNITLNLSLYDGTHFPYEDSFFDYVYSTSVFEHMSRPDLVLKEIARTLKTGGKFYLSFPNKYAFKESHTGLWGISMLPRPLTQWILRRYHSSPLEDWNLHFLSYFDIKRMARRAGLRIVITTDARTPLKKVIKKTLAFFGVHSGALLKTVILVLEKK